MKQEDIFGGAEWVCAGSYSSDTLTKPDKNGTPYFPVLRGRFNVKGVKKAVLHVLGLGFFHCYINGKPVSDCLFLPLSSDYEARANHPVDEKLTGHRIYVPEFDVTNLLRDGENVITVWFGGGWYTYEDERYGDAKAVYSLKAETSEGSVVFGSSENDKIGDSSVKTYHFATFETQDANGFDYDCLGAGFDDASWKNAVAARPLNTEYLFTDCPADKVAQTLPFTALTVAGARVYDCGINISGCPRIRVKAAAGERVEVRFYEKLKADGSPDPMYNHNQRFIYVSDGTERTVSPMFTWFAFRYLTVSGNAAPECVDVIHTEVATTSRFKSDNETLNWLYKAFLNTQYDNMHAGIPSDCPHLERRGYTGDGELTCHAVMSMADVKAFYRKWIDDISDCQDVYSGHVQYTAPYTHSGGGPGAWGCAIVEVPYQYYKHYGDIEPAARLYGQMLRYFDYLEAHSENGLVVSDKAGEWCLGDWCAPIQVVLPAPFVNNCYYIKALCRAVEIAGIIGRECDIPTLSARIAERRKATKAAYYNTWDGNFIGCLQGANAFAVEAGIGDSRTYNNLVEYYKKLGRYDTGICGTDVVTRVLFEHGDGEVAASLMTSEQAVSFEGMRREGATTLWENWPEATWARSLNHPMFGAVTAYLFDYLLGIRQEDGKAGYTDILISPQLVSQLNELSGERTVAPGKVLSVAYVKSDSGITAEITVPEGIKARFVYKGEERILSAGANSFKLK